MRQTLVLVVVAAFAAAAGFFAYRLAGPHEELVGRTAPDIVLTDLQGKRHSLDQLRGKWVLVNFWASWCAPCMEELPLLVDAQRRHGARGLQVLGPALDEADAVAPVIRRFGINYPVMADFAGADAAMQALGNTQGALPYSVLIDPHGRIVEQLLGQWSREELETLLTESLGT